MVINLEEILKGHENEMFYSPIFGEIKYCGIIDDCKPLAFNTSKGYVYFFKNGKYSQNGELMIFPSKNQIDWNEWNIKNNVKTWNDYLKDNKISDPIIYFSNSLIDDVSLCYKSSIALYKILILIETYYGGLVKEKDYEINVPKYFIDYFRNQFEILTCYSHRIFSFYTKEQAERFISSEENVKLLKDYLRL